MASPWHYLPVEVPAGTAALLVTLSYARDGGAILDLGCFGPSGFSGWSGGARSSFVISPLGATPGYLAGEVVAGLWQVAVGLYKVPAEGVRYEVTAEAVGGAGWARRVAEALAADGVGSLAPPPLALSPGERPGRHECHRDDEWETRGCIPGGKRSGQTRAEYWVGSNTRDGKGNR